MLDALARLQAFDAFADLVAVLEAVAIPWRERREALADVYLRRGYVDSAGEEWLAVCDRAGIDGPALRGLAAVATARGLDDDAAGLRRRGRSAGRGLDRLKFSWPLPNPLTTSWAMDGPDQHFTEEMSAL